MEDSIERIIKLDKILFKVSKHADLRMNQRDISLSKLNAYLSNVIKSDDWYLWLSLHTNEEGWFDLFLGDHRRYMVYDPKTQITCLMSFKKICKKDKIDDIRRVKIITIFHGRPVGQSKKNIKKNKFYRFKTKSNFNKAQNNQIRVPYFDLRQGIKESHA